MAKKKNDQVEFPTAPEEKENKKNKASKAVKEKSFRESSLMKASVPGLVLAMLIMAGILTGIHLLAKQTLDTQRNAMVRLYMQHYVSMLDVYNRSTTDAANTLSDEELVSHMGVAVEGAPSQGLEHYFRGATFAQLIPLASGIESSGLSFALTDMANRIAAGQTVRPEISFYEKGDINTQIVTHGRLIKNALGEPVAVFLIGFPFKNIADSLRNFAPEAGSIELVQKLGAERAVILKSGEGQETGALTSNTANPGWELRFLPSDALGKPGIEGTIILGLSIFAVVSIAGLLAWILMSVRREIRADVQSLDRFCENFYRHGNRQLPRLHLADFAGLLAHLDEYGKELRAGKMAALPVDSLGDISLANDSTVLGDAPAPKSAQATKKTEVAATPEAAALPSIDPSIFRAYDVRGVVGKGLNKTIAQGLGRAIGSETKARGDSTVVVGRDGRLSGPEMVAALIEGLRASGVDVIDVGMVPTPVLYFAAKTIANGSGVMVTGSHNPSDYNGFKIMIAGDTLAGDDIQALRARMEKQDFSSGMGGLRQENVAQAYVNRVSEDIALARPLTVVVDAGNGVAGAIGPRVLEELGCTVIPLFCDVDGNFPNHHPDPSKPENLQDLMASVAANNADIGIAFDGDGDRIGVVTAAGNNIFADRLMMLYAKHVLMTNPGADIIFDVKCTRDLPALISSLGGRPIMSKTGHSFIKSKLKETNAALAGEMSGHIFFNDRWLGFDDAIYSAARLLEILSLENGDSDDVFNEFPENPSTPEMNIPLSDTEKFAVMEALKYSADFPDANVITIDGLRVEFPDSWGLVRASNTTPCLVARFEGRTPEALAKTQDKFRTLLKGVDDNLQLPF